MPKFLAIALLLGILALLFHPFSPAQAQAGLDSRVSRLETELVGIQSRLSQIQSGFLPGISVPTPTLPSGDRQGTRQILSTDPQFDRLATLVIEIKERVTATETRLNMLERRQGNTNRFVR
ncbi:hypothetical protein [Phormidesmis priestleyi]|uniref:hypothetical protein n=1 Tax=Phormidesmis priestleyi TaxID=268141 RepID=UPI00083A1BE8|nr:hypothetical protein [Phormidesmis priestleyi]